MAVCQLPVVSNQPLMLNSTQVSSTRASESVALSYSIALIGFREGKKRLGRSVRKPSCQWSALDLATDNCATELPLLHRHVAVGVGGTLVIGARADQPVVIELLDDVSRPARYTRHGKHRCE